MTRWRRAPQALWRRSSNRTVVLSPGVQEPIVLDGVGSLLWELLDEPIEERDLVEHLGRYFEVEPVTIRDEVTAFLGDLGDVEAAVRA